MNDIEILEEFIDKQKSNKGTFVPTDFEITAIENLIQRNKELEEENWIMRIVDKQYISKNKIKEKIEILEKCTTNIDRKVNLTDYMIIGETERAVGRFVNLDFIKKILLEEPGYDIELLQEGDDK